MRGWLTLSNWKVFFLLEKRDNNVTKRYNYESSKRFVYALRDARNFSRKKYEARADDAYVTFYSKLQFTVSGLNGISDE